MPLKLKWFLAIFVIVYPLDQLTKLWVIEHFYYRESLTIVSGFFDLTHVRNPGGAFSLFAAGDSDYRLTFFLAAGAVAVVLLLVFYRRLPGDAGLAAAALGGILGGALGNLTDRVVYGEVIDWLDFHIGSYTWPTFNVADSCIVVGVCVLILEVFLNPENEEDDALAGNREQPSA
jgi:signal peptidase II